ncbi:MAG: TetR/AcrR family transcriptional regulator [Propioniciclava sp.]
MTLTPQQPPVPISPAPRRPLRADAQRNRQAIICAAARVFAAQGTSVTLEHIAETAGVGVGTIYRRFSSVDELASVVLEAKMTQVAEHTERNAERALSQPWEAFRDQVHFLLDQQADDVALGEVILDPRATTDGFQAQVRRTFDAATLLVERVQAAGAIRPDFDASDLYLLLHAGAGLIRGQAPCAARERLREYLLQAFRDPGSTPLPNPPEHWARPPSVSSGDSSGETA